MEPIIKSYIPSVNLVSSHLWHFLYSDKFGAQAPKINQDKAAFIDGVTGKKLTFGQMRTYSTRLAYAFRSKLGLKTGDIVMVLSNNHLYTPLIIHSCVAATLTYTSANHAYTEQEIATQLEDSGAKIIITQPDFRHKAIAAASKVGIPCSKVFNMQDDKGTEHSIWELVDENEYIPPQLTEQEAKDTTALMCYSSGTSGKPKGVESSHFNLTSVTLQALAYRKINYRDQVYISFLPFYHMYASFYFVFRNFYPGSTTVILPHFEMDLFLKTISKYKVTIVNTVPPIIVNLIKMPDTSFPSNWNSSVKEFKCGAAPLGIDAIKLFEEKFKIPLETGYGMTEGTCTIAPGNIVSGKKESVGPILPNMEAKIVDGELWVRGPNIMKGYFKNEKANKEVFTSDGFMKTGDIGYFDKDGDLYITDRVKELIKYKGFQVAPAELEDLIFKHPDISDVAVIGVPDESKSNELPRAYVVLKDHAKGRLTAEEIIEWAAKQTAPYKRLRGGIIFRDSIPKSPSGKILRRFLRDEVAREENIKAKL